MDFYEKYTLDESKVVGDIEAFDSNVRRPRILIMGKPVAPEKAQQIIAREEPLFHCDPDSRFLDRGVLKNIVYRPGYDWLDTWIYPSGEICGCILELCRHPSLNGILPDWVEFAKHTDDIDMVVCYTDNNEGKCHYCIEQIYDEQDKFDEVKFWHEDCPEYQYCVEKRKKTIEDHEKRECDWSDYRHRYWLEFDTSHIQADICNDVMLCIHIQNGDYTLYFGEFAVTKAKEYYSKYYDARLDGFYNNSVFNVDKYHILSNEYILECFKMQGKSEADYNKAVESKLFIPMTDQNEVMTPEKYLSLLETDWKGYIY